jgi:hypothetical protein
MDTDIADQSHSGTCKLPLLKQGTNLWGSSERIKVREMAAETGIGHCALQQKVQSLEYQKVCALWVPCLLREKHKFQRGKNSYLTAVERYAVKGDDFLQSTVTCDESWFYHFNLETK